MKLTDIWIVVGKQVKPATGNVRGSLVMVPSPHGPLYFKKPQWFETKTEAEEHVRRRLK